MEAKTMDISEEIADAEVLARIDPEVQWWARGQLAQRKSYLRAVRCVQSGYARAMKTSTGLHFEPTQKAFNLLAQEQMIRNELLRTQRLTCGTGGDK